ncbi:MAG: hydroxyphenylacetyl-CoA thioesterase PaaI [Granulosicoccus sp.]
MPGDDPQTLAELCASALWATDTAAKALDIEIESIAPGSATLVMRIRENMTNGHGTCHGGYIFTLADAAFAFACNTYNQRCVAQHCSISYLAPALCGDRLEAVAREISRIGRNGIYDVVVSCDRQGTIAEFRGHSRTIKDKLLPEA